MSDSVTAVILAAGQSRRMGRPKGYLPIGNRTFLSHLIHTLKDSVQKVVVVTGAYRYAVDAPKERVEFVHATHWRSGMRASLARGLQACDDGWILLTHVDRPLVQHDTIQRVLKARSKNVVVPTFGGQYGHPILIPPGLRRRLKTIEDIPLSRLVINAQTATVPVADPGIILNLNHPSDYGLTTTVFGKFALSACIDAKGA